MKKLIILLPFLLSGCLWEFSKPESLPQLVTEESTQYVVPTIDISPILLEECEDLIVLSPSATFEDVLGNHADTIAKYSKCRDKHKALKSVINQSLGVK